MKIALAIIALVFLVPFGVLAQTSTLALPPQARFLPGEALHYELEVHDSLLSQPEQGTQVLDPPACDYLLSAVLTLEPQTADKDGNTPVRASYANAKISSWHCEGKSQEKLQTALKDLQHTPVTFQIGPQGEVGFVHADEDEFVEWRGTELLEKLTLDLLQGRLAPNPVQPGESWKPRGQFLYWKEYAMSGLDLSASAMRLRGNVDLAGEQLAAIETKYVFSPLDVPAGVTSRYGRIRTEGTAAVSALLDVSLLFNSHTKRIDWLHRSQEINNEVSLKDPAHPAEDPQYGQTRKTLASIHLEETGTARFIRAEDSVAWLAALKQFEQSPLPKAEAPQPSEGADHSLVDLARETRARVGSKAAHHEIDTVEPTPAGFTRWDKAFCENSWTCMTVSVALPGSVEISDQSPQISVYLAQTTENMLSVAVGPALDRQHPGLTDTEELRKQSTFFLNNRLWLASGPALPRNSEVATLGGYPALITEFRCPRRDLADMDGMFVMLLTPWGKLVPAGCSFDHSDSSSTLHSLCEQVVKSLRVHR